MVRVLDRKLVRELFAAKGVLAAIVSIIVVGVMCLVTMAAVYNNLQQARLSYYSQCRMADFGVHLTKVPRSALERVESVPGVSEVRPRIVFDATVDLVDVARPISARVLSLPDEPAPVINNILLRSGGYFTGSRRNEVIINDAFARAHALGAGDRIHLLLNNRRQELHVVGTAISSEFVYLLPPGGLVPNADAYGVFYVPESLAEEVFDFEGACNNIVGLLGPAGRSNPERVLNEIEAVLDEYGVVATTPRARQPSHWFLMNEIAGLKVTAMILPAVFLGVAAMVLNVLMLRMTDQQRTVIGTLKALGYADRALFVHYLKFGVAIGLLGGVLGAALGHVLAGLLAELYTQYFEFPSLVNRPYPLVILMGIGVSVVFSVLGVLRGITRVLRLAPAEAMRPRPPIQGRRVFLEAWQWAWRSIGFRWQMVLRDIFRHRLRTATGMLAAAAGSILLLMTFSMRDAMYEMIDFQFEKVLLSDFDVAFKDARDFSAVHEMRTLPGVDAVEPLFVLGCTLKNGHRSHKGGVTGVTRDARMTVPRNLAGRPVAVPESGLLLTRRLADRLDVRAGDALDIVPVKGDKTPRRVRVAAINDSYLGLVAYADFSWLNHLVGENDAVTSVQLQVDPRLDATDTFYRSLKHLPAVQGVAAIRSQKEQLMNVFVDQMLVSIVIVIVFAAVIFFGSILNSSLISLEERKQQVATFRVLGYSAHDVGMIFLRESLVVNLLGTLLGLPLGYLAALKIGELYSSELFRMPFVIGAASWWSTGILAVLFALVAHLPVQRIINRLNWVETLNIKE